ncbi:hypothetical protein ACFQZV_10575 [Microbacterium koreense]|uniref:Lipoprotein n=1 Tax=Microbacterium koreense TaxID=323761 RepID=A0ABW2ZT14_9MICO
MSTSPFRLLIPAALTLALVGCAADTPEEPAPPFASETEAFAAAEATYRAYVDALNQVDLSDPETFEAVYAWTTGDTLAEAKRSLTQMHADDWEVRGRSIPTTIVRSDHPDVAAASQALAVCLDVSSVELENAEGESMVALDRMDVQQMLVTLERDDSAPIGLKVASVRGRDGSPECD